MKAEIKVLEEQEQMNGPQRPGLCSWSSGLGHGTPVPTKVCLARTPGAPLFTEFADWR